MGFSAKLSQASDEIEARAVLAATEIDVKAVMDLVRTFLEEVVEEASRKIEPKVGRAAPAGPRISHYAPYRQYLESAGIVGPEESALLQTLYNFLSNQSTHKLGAAPEQLRVAHVTVIEWCLLIVGRVRVSGLARVTGPLVIPSDQKLARLAFILFDPRSDDGLTAWNILDAVLGSTPAATFYPVIRTMNEVGK